MRVTFIARLGAFGPGWVGGATAAAPRRGCSAFLRGRAGNALGRRAGRTGGASAALRGVRWGRADPSVRPRVLRGRYAALCAAPCSARADAGPVRGDPAGGAALRAVGAERGVLKTNAFIWRAPRRCRAVPRAAVGFPTAKGSGAGTAPNPHGAAMGISETSVAL